MSRHPLVVFAYFLALATLFRVELPWVATSDYAGLNRYSGWAVFLCAIALLARPTDIRIFVTLCVIQLVDVAIMAPWVPNHWLLTSCATAGIMAAFAQLAIQHRRWPDHQEVWDQLVGPMRVGVASFYGFTGFWKLNDHFVDPGSSCAVEAVERMGRQMPMFPTGALAQQGAIGMTLVLELLGPILLLVPATRRVALAAFVCFHALLALDFEQGFLNFSGVMFTLLIFFLDAPAIQRGLSPLDPLRIARPLAAMWFAAAATVALLASLLPELAFRDPYEAIRWRVFVLLYLPFTLCFFLSAVRVPTPNPWPGASRSYAWLFAVLVLLNGLCPWLGIKDRNSWQMYSNLRLEPGASNHWIIPHSLDLLGLQSDTVQVKYVSYGYLNTVWTAPNVEVRWYMLRWHAWQDPAMAISYLRDGVTHEAATVAEDPLLTPPSWPLRKISWFRPAGPPVAEQCQW